MQNKEPLPADLEADLKKFLVVLSTQVTASGKRTRLLVQDITAVDDENIAKLKPDFKDWLHNRNVAKFNHMIRVLMQSFICNDNANPLLSVGFVPANGLSVHNPSVKQWPDGMHFQDDFSQYLNFLYLNLFWHGNNCATVCPSHVHAR
jgi:hypothetical protein